MKNAACLRVLSLSGLASFQGGDQWIWGKSTFCFTSGLRKPGTWENPLAKNFRRVKTYAILTYSHDEIQSSLIKQGSIILLYNPNNQSKYIGVIIILTQSTNSQSGFFSKKPIWVYGAKYVWRTLGLFLGTWRKVTSQCEVQRSWVSWSLKQTYLVKWLQMKMNHIIRKLIVYSSWKKLV